MIDSRYFVDVFSDIVDSMRSTGSITASSEVNSIYTITASNDLSQGDSVEIDSINYITLSASATGFSIEAVTGLDFTGKTWKALAPYDDYGTINEISKRLSDKDGGEKEKYQKYPLVALYQPFKENPSEDIRVDYTLPFTIIIVNYSEATNTTKERYNTVFKPILYPIYYAFLGSISILPYFNTISVDDISHSKTDLPSWGVGGTYGFDGLILNEHQDCIRIDFDGLDVLKDSGIKCQ